MAVTSCFSLAATACTCGQLDSTDTRRLLETDTDRATVYAADHLFFIRGGTLWAQRFDAVSQTLQGIRFPIAEDVTVADVAGAARSAVGPIAYRSGPRARQRQFVWVGRDGKEIARVGPPYLR